jgi:hypothetical protein
VGQDSFGLSPATSEIYCVSQYCLTRRATVFTDSTTRHVTKWEVIMARCRISPGLRQRIKQCSSEQTCNVHQNPAWSLGIGFRTSGAYWTEITRARSFFICRVYWAMSCQWTKRERKMRYYFVSKTSLVASVTLSRQSSVPTSNFRVMKWQSASLSDDVAPTYKR